MNATATGRTSWDLFCRVVDNFGDVGIAWRLAKQLAADPRRTVRLFVDGLDAFARIEPLAVRDRDGQTLDGIEVLRWPADDAAFDTVAAVVVEVLGCGLPAGYLDAMVQATTRHDAPPSVWIDFEHLSAEPWVASFHGLPSPHPRLPLVKHFFYPGFGARTGGLLIEPDLAERRAAFVADPDAVAALWQRLGVPPPRDDEIRLSLFAYDDAPVDTLFAALAANDDHRWFVVVPEGVAGAAVERFFCGEKAGVAGRTRDALTVMTVPFVDQSTYDRLLWACDANFVRGEDSFVRAQAAGRPFVWQIYRQAQHAHRAKLEAFEQRYAHGMSEAAQAAQRAVWSAWNDPAADLRPALRAWLAERPALAAHAERWRARRSAEAPLIDRLLAFVASPGPPADVADLLD